MEDEDYDAEGPSELQHGISTIADGGARAQAAAAVQVSSLFRLCLSTPCASPGAPLWCPKMVFPN